jgi:hypothetical protein
MGDLAEEEPGILGLEEDELVEAGIGGGHAGRVKFQGRSLKQFVDGIRVLPSRFARFKCQKLARGF